MVICGATSRGLGLSGVVGGLLVVEVCLWVRLWIRLMVLWFECGLWFGD